MASIDERIVRMKLDSTQFVKGAGLVVTALQLINKALEMKNASKGFDSINKGANSVKLDGISTGLDQLNSRFSALGVVGMSALNNVANAAISAGQRIVNEFIAPVTQGFQEYELQMNSVQTILANTSSKGTTLDQVNSALNELNTYADKTIYNFAEMTRNIGTFTAAGVDLDTSVSSIKGLANLAAASGSSATQAATAMYQLSQAIAAGRVSLMDWNSVVNAGMGGELFQNALKRTAENMGKDVDGLIEKYGSFRESLTEGQWLTTDVLTETLKQISGAYTESDLIAQGYSESQAKEITSLAKTAEDAATKVKTFTQLVDTSREALGSGWAQTWQIIFGDFEEAKALWTGVADVVTGKINEMSQSRNELLQGWADLGGRTKLIEGVGDAFKALGKIVDTVGEAFRDVFPKTTAKQLMDLTDQFADFTKRMMISDETADKLRRTFEGVFSIFDIGFKALKAVAKGFVDVISSVLDLGGGFLDVTANIGDFISAVDDALTSTNIFEKAIGGVANAVGAIVDLIKRFGEVIGDVFDAIRDGFDTSSISRSFDSMVGSFSKADKIDGFADVLVGAFQKIVDFFGPALEALSEVIGDAIGMVADFVGEFLSNVDVQALLDLINTGLLAGIFKTFKDFVDNFTKKIDDIQTIGKTFKSVMGTVEKTMEHFQGALDAVKLAALASSIGMLADALVKISKLDEETLYDSLSAIAALFVELLVAMSAFSKLSFLDLGGVTPLVVGMLGIAGAVDMLSYAVKELAKLPLDGLVQAIGAVQVIMLEFTFSMMSLSAVIGPTIRVSAAMILFAAAIDLLVPAVVALSNIDVVDLCKSIAALGSVMMEFAAAMLMLNSVKMGMEQAASFAVMVAAINLLVPAVAVLSTIDAVDLCKSIAALGAALLELTAFIVALPDSGKMVLAGAGLIQMSAAILVLAGAMKLMAMESWDELARSLLGFSTALMGLTVAMLAMPEGPKLLQVGSGLILVSVALNLIAVAMKQMGSMSFEDLTKGMIMFSTVLSGFILALTVLKSNISGAAALLVAAAAMTVFAQAIKTMSSLGWEGLAVALVGIAGAIGVLAVSSLLLSGMIPVFTAAAAAMAIFGAGLALVGVGLLAMGASLAAFAASGIAAAAGIEAVLKAVIGVIPDFIDGVVEGIVSAMDVLKKGAPAIAEGITAVLSALLDSLNKLVPKMVEVLANVIDEALKSLSDHIPSMADSLFKILIGVINVAAERAPELIDSLKNLVGNILTAAFGEIKDFKLADISDLFIAVSGFGALFAVLGGMKTMIKNGLLSAVMLAGGLAILGGVFVALAKLAPENVLETATSMSEVFIAIAGVMAIASMIPVGAALQGIGSLAIAVGGITAIIAAMGAISQIPGFDWLISEGTTALKSIGNAIGGFVGSIVGGVLGGVSDSFPSIATNLSDFMENLKPFFEDAAAVPDGAAETVSAIASAILALTASQIIDGLTSWATGGVDFTKFANDLAAFGPAIKDFATEVAGTDFSGIEPAMSALKTIADASKTLPNQGGFVGLLVGDNTLTMMAQNLNDFGPAIKGFADNVRGIDTSGVAPAMDALKKISDVANELPNQGGAAGFWAGENDLSTFAGNLETFGTALVNFSVSVEGINAENLERAIAVLQSLINVTNGIQMNKTGGFFGSGQLDGLEGTVKAFTSLGSALAKFQSAVGDSDFSNVENAAMAIQKASYWFANISAVDPTGIDNLKKAIDNCGDLGLNKLNENLSNLVGKVNTKMKNLVDALTTQSGAIGLALSDLKAQIESKSGGLGGTLTVNMQAMVDAIKNRSGDFKTSFTAIEGKFDDFRTNIGNKLDDSKETVRSKLTQILSTINGFQQQFKDAGTSLVTSLASGFNDPNALGTMSSAVSSALSSAVSTASNYNSSFYYVGSNIAAGLVQGIKDQISSVASASGSMADAAPRSAKGKLLIASPSKVFRKIGNFTGEGFVLGIKDYVGKASTMASSLALSARNGISNAMSSMSSIGSMHPTITPVLDMSKTSRVMTNRAGILDGASLGIKGLSLNDVRGDEIKMMDQYYRKIQNSNAQVANAISDLRGDMSKYTDAINGQETAVYVDGRKLASAIAKPMNQELGIRSRRGSLSRV